MIQINIHNFRCIIRNIVSSFRFRKQFTQSSSQHHQSKRGKIRIFREGTKFFKKSTKTLYFLVLSVKVTMDDNSIIRTESSYQTINEHCRISTV